VDTTSHNALKQQQPPPSPWALISPYIFCQKKDIVIIFACLSWAPTSPASASASAQKQLKNA